MHAPKKKHNHAPKKKADLHRKNVPNKYHVVSPDFTMFSSLLYAPLVPFFEDKSVPRKNRRAYKNNSAHFLKKIGALFGATSVHFWISLSGPFNALSYFGTRVVFFRCMKFHFNPKSLFMCVCSPLRARGSCAVEFSLPALAGLGAALGWAGLGCVGLGWTVGLGQPGLRWAGCMQRSAVIPLPPHLGAGGGRGNICSFHIYLL